MGDHKIGNNCDAGFQLAEPCSARGGEKPPEAGQRTASDWPRNPDYRRLYQEHKEKNELGDNFRLVFKAPFAQTGSPAKRTLGAGGDLVISLSKVSSFDIGLGYVNFPFKEVGGTGQRINLFLDFNRVSCRASFRLGVYTEMPQFGDFEDNRDTIAAGVSPEIILNLYGDGRIRFGFGIAPGIGISSKGLDAMIAGATTLSLQF